MSGDARRARALAPRAPRSPRSKTVHGVTLVDDYAWLRADNWRDVLRDSAALAPDIRAFLEAENAYADAILKPTRDLQRAILKEMRGRIKEDDAEPPAPDGPWEYFTRFRDGGENELFCRRPRGGGPETILVDGDSLARGKEFFEFGAFEQSRDHRFVAWSADASGSEFYAIHIRDVATGEDIDSIPDTEGSFVWSANSATIYYVRLDSEHRPNQVFAHVIGSTEPDALVFEESDPAWFVHLGETQSRRYAIIDVSDHDSNESRLLDLAQEDPSPILVAAREPTVRYDVEHSGERLLIRTNAGGARDFKIVEAPAGAPGKANWRDFIAHQAGRMIVAHAVYSKNMVRLERLEGLPRLVIRDLATGAEHTVAFDEPVYTLRMEELSEFDSPMMRFSYSSLRTPEEIYDYDMEKRTRVLVKRQDIPSGHDPERYETARVFAPARDGRRVPISLLYRKDVERDGSAPLLLYGYGAYGHATPASFRANRFSLVDRGFVFAIAHVRGGSDCGWDWYLDGKLEKKTNTFDDFIAAAEYLVEQNYTRKGKLIAQGGSAGGMLMGVIANRAPSLFGGVIADVPFVDVLNTMLDAELPLTPPEWLEWGNPIADKTAFDRIRSYSPYDNVVAQDYPPILALAGLSDPRVTYWEPAKWAARLRANMTGGGPVLLKTNLQAGHGGASGRFKSLEEAALQYAFAIASATGRLGK